MNTKIVVEMQNGFGRFMQLYHLNKMNLALELFTSDATLWLPDRDIKATGTEEIKEALAKMQAERIALGKYRDVHMPHTPAFDTQENDTVGVASWDVHSFYIEKSEDVTNMIYDYGRIDCRYKEENGRWLISSLDWWDVESFTPWQYDIDNDEALNNCLDCMPLPPAYTGLTTTRDFYKCNNIMSRFAQNNRKYAFEDTFADVENVSYRALPFTVDAVVGKEAIEAEFARYKHIEEDLNDGLYYFVPCTGAPVIEISEDGNTIDAQWLTSYCTFEGKAFGINEPPYMFIRRCAITTVKFIRCGNDWRMVSYDAVPFMTVPGFGFDSYCQMENPKDNKWYQRVGMFENKWKPAPPKMGGDFPEELPFLEATLARWVSAYRRGDYENFFEENCFNDEHETLFHSRGRGRCAASVIGSDKIHEFFSLGAFHYHHQQITNHGGMSPDIEISADGRYATMSYFDINTTAFDPGKSNEKTIDVPDDWNQENSGFEHCPCRYQVSAYNLAAAKVDGVWKLIKIDWETLVAFPVIYLEGKASKGWAGSVTDFKYPKLFEKYQYSPIRKVPGTK